jgi:heme A synthase
MGFLVFVLILVLLAMAGILGFILKVALGVALGIFLGVLVVSALVMWRFRRVIRRGRAAWRRTTGSSTIDVFEPRDPRRG